MSDDRGSKGSLLEFLSCEALDVNLFRGQSKDFKTGQVYGGQVLGQAIRAAYNTLDDERYLHSAHAYFLTRGDVNAPIIYEVDRSLDGGSFSSRRVVAIQHGRQIFHLSASFQKPEEGMEYFEKATIPLELLDSSESNAVPERQNFQSEYFDVIKVPREQTATPFSIEFWMKAKHALPNDVQNNHAVLAYISDMGLLLSTLVPHELDEPDYEKRFSKVLMASLDHALWLHRPFRADDWLFYRCEVQSTGNGRGLAFGKIFDRAGELVASTSQEGLLRLRRPR